VNVNGYKPLSDWYVLGGICFLSMFIGFIGAQFANPIPNQVREVMVEVMRCHRETGEICSIMVMPNSSEAEVYLLYSQYVK
jgi:hypothetical protein